MVRLCLTPYDSSANTCTTPQCTEAVIKLYNACSETYCKTWNGLQNELIPRNLFQLKPVKFVHVCVCNPGFLFWSFVWKWQRLNVVQLQKREHKFANYMLVCSSISIQCWVSGMSQFRSPFCSLFCILQYSMQWLVIPTNMPDRRCLHY